ncbi:uncharacterized protein [Amphiura filiformis]|uniref:uncharacterized protein n=1 Tax=Amphiura filiformis TaxID=82378 RepID=UPI003B210D89
MAFDLINHKIVVIKLMKLGAPPILVQWVVDFLTNRKQRVKYKDTYSDWVLINGGVPQGTVIGSRSFLGMINDALDVPNHKVWKYVDDLTIGENRAYGDASTVQDSLDSLCTWADENKLRLNPAK